MADAKISALTELAAAPASGDLLALVDVSDTTQAASGTTKRITAANLLLGAKLGQVVNSFGGAVATGTTTMPWDDTIPQNTEGTEFSTCAITPANASSNLLIIVQANWAISTQVDASFAVFVDSTADALFASSHLNAGNNRMYCQNFHFIVAAGSTSARTYKLRIGGHSASTITLNGASAARKFGGIAYSGLLIVEILP